MKILVVDDNPEQLESLASLLEKNNFEVIKTDSASRALRLLQKTGPVDMILTDLIMPRLTGFDFMKSLKEDKMLRRIPVILCTGDGKKESVLKGISLGAADIIAKPIDSETLIKKVRKIQEKMPGAILVVDDEDLFRDYLGNVIKFSGYKPLLAASGKEALKLADAYKISMIISDIKMPEMDGFELMERIRRKFPIMPVLLMSGYVDMASEAGNFLAQADGFISKPFHNTDIIREIERLVPSSG